MNLYTTPAGAPLFVQPPGVPMGPFDTPNAGISLNGQMYLVCNSGSDATQPNPHLQDYSVLARFDETTQQFTTGRTISKMPSGHFIITSLHNTTDTSGSPQVAVFGLGPYRATNVYLVHRSGRKFRERCRHRLFHRNLRRTAGLESQRE